MFLAFSGSGIYVSVRVLLYTYVVDHGGLDVFGWGIGKRLDSRC